MYTKFFENRKWKFEISSFTEGTVGGYKEIDSKEFTFENNYFKYTFESPSNNSGDITYNYKLAVKDINGIKKDPINGSFKYSNSTIRLTSNDNAYSYPGPEVFSGTQIVFEAADNVDILYYTVNDGPKINIS